MVCQQVIIANLSTWRNGLLDCHAPASLRPCFNSYDVVVEPAKSELIEAPPHSSMVTMFVLTPHPQILRSWTPRAPRCHTCDTALHFQHRSPDRSHSAPSNQEPCHAEAPFRSAHLASELLVGWRLQAASSWPVSSDVPDIQEGSSESLS